MGIKYYIAYENYLYKFDYNNYTHESWQIDEHNLSCVYNIQNADDENDLNNWFNFLQNTCKIPYTSISEDEFIKLLSKFNSLMEMQEKINELKLNYTKQVKEYLTNF